MDGADLVRWGAIGFGTLVVLVTALVVGGFVILFRRRGATGSRTLGPVGVDALGTRAGSMLVRLDDALRDADQELGFAIAQFGADRARGFGEALGVARGKVAEAFRLQQALDDAYPDSDRERREWTNQILALCEQADRAIAEQSAAFAALRRQEVNAAATLSDLRARIERTEQRIAAARTTLASLRERYDSPALAAVSGNPDAAAAALERSRAAADAAEPGLSQHGISAVADALEQAAQTAHSADVLLDAIETVDRDLAAAAQSLADRRAALRADLQEAKAQRDAAPDPQTQRGILDAMAAVDAALGREQRDPAAALDALNGAAEQLDLALASARNQASRLQHARAAYESTLVFAQSQIATARSVMGGAGVTARTRLAEAERQLALAQVATDPVEALDTVRRAVTHARDAEDLARYGS